MLASNRMLILAVFVVFLYVLYRRGMLSGVMETISNIAPMPAPAAPGITEDTQLPAPEIPKEEANNPDARKAFPIGMCQWSGDANDDYKDSYANFPPSGTGKTDMVQNAYMSTFSGAGSACRQR